MKIRLKILTTMKWICFTIIFIIPVSLFSQSLNPSLNDVIPSSPNVRAIEKYGKTKVNLSTGIPIISIPLFSYKNANNELALNLSLDYNAGGIRVNKVASDVGLGWSLRAGGVISRTLRGKPDESNFGFLYYDLPDNETEGNTKTSVTPFQQIASLMRDGKCDIYNYNFGNISGRFLLGKNNDILMLESNRLRVEKTISNIPNYLNNPVISQFVITNEKGVKYVFDALEQTLATNVGWASAKRYISSWYLTKIIAPFNTDTIEFSYIDESYNYDEAVSDSYTIGLNGFDSRTESSSLLSKDVIGKRIKKIQFPNGVHIDFEYATTQRVDLPQKGVGAGMFELKKITIQDKNTSRGYNLIHNYILNRLTLLKVVPFDDNGIEDSSYSFEYYDGGGNAPFPLPDRLTNEQDHWGFYNAHTSALIPGEYFVDGTDGGNAVMLPGGDKNVNTKTVKYGSLSKLHYPSGGYTQFEMEANKAFASRLHRTFYIKSDPHHNIGIPIFIHDGQTGSRDFTIDPDPNTSLQFHVEFNRGSSPCVSNSCRVVLDIYNSAGHPISSEYISVPNNVLTIQHDFSRTLDPGTYTLKVYSQGLDGFAEYITTTCIETRQTPPTPIQVDDPYVGGLRVKKISNFDGIHPNPVSSRIFQYLKEDGTTSSGTLGVYPVYSYLVHYDGRESIALPESYVEPYNPGDSPNSIVRASSPVLTSPIVNGSPVVYSRVIEKFMNNGKSNGKIVKYFTSYDDFPVYYLSDFPFTPPQYEPWSYGLLKKQLFYDASDLLVKKIENEYDFTMDQSYLSDQTRISNFTSVSLAPVKYLLVSDYSESDYWLNAERPIYFKAKYFSPNPGRSDLISTKITEYTGSNSLNTDITYTYDHNFNVKTKTTTNSKGQRLKDIFYYPYDYNLAATSLMVSHNIYNVPIARENWKIDRGQYLIGGYINEYEQVNSGIRKQSVFTFNSEHSISSSDANDFDSAVLNANPGFYTKAFKYAKYSPKGFIAEQSKNNDKPYSYLWDYRHQKPICEVVNASRSDIAYTSFEADGKGNWEFTGSPSTTNGGLTGKHAYSLTTGTISRNELNSSQEYIISYWLKSGGSVTVSGGSNTGGTTGKTINNWTYHQVKVTGATTIKLSGSGYIDEIRLYPSNAQMTTYSYNLLTGMTSKCSQNNELTFYEYDGFGRLIRVRDEENNILKEYSYKYQTSPTE